MKFKSKFLEEFNDRGYLNQATNLINTDSFLNKAQRNIYLGFDCTASSLHLGSLIQIMILRLLQKHGHQPIILLGGGTTKIGDPSGKSKERELITESVINNNLSSIKNVLLKFDLTCSSENYKKFIFVNNDNWLSNIRYTDFLINYGKYFSLSKMLNMESVKLRLEREQSISFLEFNYMILQAYDFYHLNKEYDCNIQIGGQDQWGNIINGVELIKRLNSLNDIQNNEAFGLTTLLLLNKNGNKMGKTENGAIWLDENILSPYEYFQYFRNIDDIETIKFLKLFTELSLSEIEKLSNKDINHQKEILAFEATKICHGKESAKESLKKANEIFLNGNDINYLPSKTAIFSDEEFKNGKFLFALLRDLELCKTGKEGKRLIQGKAIKVNGKIIEDINFLITETHFLNESIFKISIGKKKFFRIEVKKEN